MISESRLRGIVRGILLREMKTTDSGAGEPIRSKHAAPEVATPTPVTAALKLLTVARNDRKVMGEEISMTIWASRHDPQKLLALTRLALGREATSRFESAEIETLKDQISTMFPEEAR